MPSTRTMAGPRLLMSMRDIAELAGKPRPLITTWRKRDKSFPAPAGGDVSRPYFDPHEVAEWLVRTNRIDPDGLEAELSLYTVARLGDPLAAKDRIAFVTSLICLRRLTGEEPLADGADDVVQRVRTLALAADPEDMLLRSEILDTPPTVFWLATAVDDLVEATWSCAGAFEKIMRERYRLNAAEISADAITPQLAQLVAKLSGAAETAASRPVTVSDLAVGPGDLLAAVIDLLGPDRLPACSGAERDPYLARLTRRRLAVHGLELDDMDIRVGDDVPDEAGDPDVIVTQIPYTSTESRSADQTLARLADITVRLGDGCSAAILGPADVLAGELQPFSDSERARANLLGNPIVEAVIRLPGGLVRFRPGYEVALWVLSSVLASSSDERLLVADVSDRELTPDVADTLVEDIVTWRRAGYDPVARRRELAVPMLRSHLTDRPGLLLARKPRDIRTEQAVAEEQLTHVIEVESSLDSMRVHATAARPAVRSKVIVDLHPRPSAKSVGRLVREGLLKVVNGTRLEPGHVSPDGHHAVLGPDEVLGVRKPGSRRIDRAVFATSYPRGKLTQPGDILVTLSPRLGVFVDSDGFSIVDYPVRALRITENGKGLFTPRVLAAILVSANTSHRPFGAIRQSRRLEEHQVTQLASSVVERLDSLLTAVEERRRHAQAELDLLEELGGLVVTGLADGTLALAGDMK